MKKTLLLSMIFLFCGCFAYVDEDNNVKSVGVKKDEVLDILRRMDEKPSEERSVIFHFEKKTANQPH